MSETDAELIKSARAALAECSAANKHATTPRSQLNAKSRKTGDGECFLTYNNDDKQQPPIVVVVGDGRSRVRRFVRTATRHVTVVSFSTRFKETRTHTSHHVTTVSFPQKAIDSRSDPSSSQYLVVGSQRSAGGSNTTATSSLNGSINGAGCIYLQEHCSIPTSSISNATCGSTDGMQHLLCHQQQPSPLPQTQQEEHLYSSCHQQKQQQQHGHGNAIAAAVAPEQYIIGTPKSHYHMANQQKHHHHHHLNFPVQQQQLYHQHQLQHHHHKNQQHNHHHNRGGAIVMSGSGMGTPTQNKQNSIRNGSEVHKRSRAQTAYELSQDLLEKKIELLERKYGGVRARNAAVTIQRAFRHHMMVKKFASITAMAKAEKRLSRRMFVGNVGGSAGSADHHGVYVYNSSSNVTEEDSGQHAAHMHGQYMQQQRVKVVSGQGASSMITGSTGNVATSGGSSASNSLSRTPPARSMSMRERRPLDGLPIPRSQSGSSTSLSSGITHPHPNMLHATEFTSHYYTAAMAMEGGMHYYTTPTMLQHDASFNSSASSAGSSAHLDSSLNSSWIINSPHTPYYSAAQIYMRPKAVPTNGNAATAAAANAAKRIPPEVPKRTSSITQQQMLLRQTPLRANGLLCKSSENGSLTSVQSSGSESSVTSAERIIFNSDLGSDRSNTPPTWKQRSHNHASSTPRIVALAAGNESALVTGAEVTNIYNPSGSLTSSSGSSACSQTAATASAVAVVPSETSDDHAISSHTSAAQYEAQLNGGSELQMGAHANATGVVSCNYKVSETIRKRQYRVGLNLFNKKPEKGITYLIRRGFLENTPQGVARFLISRKGLSRQMIGEYLGNLQNQFNMAVLNCFAIELDLSGMQVDVALRKFQTYFRMPGEAQKIERLMEIFSQRYCQCNQDIVGRLKSSDTIFVLAFAIIMLNTDLHTPNLKPERRMRPEDFIKNLRGIDDCHDIDKEMLMGIYERVKATEFKPGSDHVTQVMKVQGTIVGKKPNLSLPHRRLVCYCRLYEIPDINKRERPGVHQREVFLFNDLLVITKIFSKKKSSVTYAFRNSYPLCGMVVNLLDLPHYLFCIQLSQKVDSKILITFNARNEHDRCKFADDLKESISEMDEMEALRIEAELDRQKSARNRTAGSGDNRDSGVADVELCSSPFQGAPKVTAGGTGDSGMLAAHSTSAASAVHAHVNNQEQVIGGAAMANGSEAIPLSDGLSQQLKRSALSNSLLDMHEQFSNEKPQRRGSVGSLDSGMSISFQSTTTSTVSRDNAAAVIAAAANAAAAKMRFTLPTLAQSVTSQQQHQQHYLFTARPHISFYNNNSNYNNNGDSGNQMSNLYVHQQQTGGPAMLMQPHYSQQQQQQAAALPNLTSGKIDLKIPRPDDNLHSTDV